MAIILIHYRWFICINTIYLISDIFVLQKLYTISDICLGLLLSRSTTITIKEYPVDLKLPKALYCPAPMNFRNPDFNHLMKSREHDLGNPNTALLQFTPNKNSRIAKEALMPSELVKIKNTTATIKQSKWADHFLNFNYLHLVACITNRDKISWLGKLELFRSRLLIIWKQTEIKSF